MIAARLGVAVSSVSLWTRDITLTEAQHERLRQANPMLGCMLHWAEGSKARNRVVFTNSDPAMLRAFLGFLRGSCQVGDERITLSINCHLNNGLSPRARRGRRP